MRKREKAREDEEEEKGDGGHKERTF